MKKMKYYIFSVAFVVAMCIATDVFSAGPPPPTGGPQCWPPPCVPIDGGIGFLLVAGMAYGGKKMYDLSTRVEKAD